MRTIKIYTRSWRKERVFIGKKLISNWTTRLHELLGFTQTVPNVHRQLSEFNGAVCNDSTYKTVAIFRGNKAQEENERVSTQYVAILRSAVAKALMRSVLCWNVAACCLAQKHSACLAHQHSACLAQQHSARLHQATRCNMSDDINPTSLVITCYANQFEPHTAHSMR